jgi:pyruvate kinase
MNELWYTPGPASLGKEEEILRAGATGARLTFSFGTPPLQEERARRLREAARQASRPCRVVADLAGEKFRLGEFVDGPSIPVRAGDPVRLVAAGAGGSADGGLTLPVVTPDFFAVLNRGAVVVIGDGGAILAVTANAAAEARAEAAADGVIDQCRGLTVQGAGRPPASLTDKDLADLDFVLGSPAFDSVAVSFVASAADVLRVRDRATRARREIAVVAKIETPAGVAEAGAVCRVADQVLVGRGDLALTAPWTELFGSVRTVAAAARSQGVPWLLATQIAEGLERFAFPTRAEICDLAHWLQEGCAGVLLSYETAFGRRPVDAVAAVAALLAHWGTTPAAPGRSPTGRGLGGTDEGALP